MLNLQVLLEHARFYCTADGRIFNQPFAIDTETTLIDKRYPGRIPEMIIAGASDGEKLVYIAPEHVSDFIQIHHGDKMIQHNAAFDLAVLQQVCGNQTDVYGFVDEGRVVDTMILDRCYRLGTQGDCESDGSSLADCCQRYLLHDLDKIGKDAHGRQIRTNFGQWRNNPRAIPPEYLRYVADDVIATYRLYRRFQDLYADLFNRIVRDRPFGYVDSTWLREVWLRFGVQTHHIQLKSAITLAEATRNGLNVDKVRLERFRNELTDERNGLVRAFVRFCYRPGEKGCNNSLQQILRSIEQGNPDIRFDRTPTGKICSAADSLEPFADAEPFIRDYLRYQAINKLLQSFLEKMNKGRLYAEFDILKRTGRTSAFGDISAQNLPRDERIRKLFIPSPGHVFLDADYSAVEMATLSQCTRSQFGGRSAMGDAINAGADLHRLIASRMTGKPENQITKDERQKAKAVNFGFPGGMGLKTFRAYAKMNYGIDLSETEAERLKNVWFDTFPEMSQFLGQSGNLGEDIAHLIGINVADYAVAVGQQTIPDTSKIGMLGWLARKTFMEKVPKYKDGRPYSPALREYFWKRLDTIIERMPEKFRESARKHTASEDLTKAVSSLASQSGVLTLTGRLRVAASYCARHNTVFQGLAADGAKLAMWKLWRAGFRIVNFIHDEFLIEVPEQADYTESAERIKGLMIEGMREVAPDIKIDVEYAVSRRWSKNATATRDPEERLVAYDNPVDVD